MAIILISFILLYILREGKDLIKIDPGRKACWAWLSLLSAWSMALITSRKAVLCPTWARCLRNCSLYNRFQAFLGC